MAEALVVQDFAPNRLDTPAQRRFAFPGQQLASELLSRNIDIRFFGESRLEIPIVLWIHSAGRCIMNRWQESTAANIIAALELVAPNLPEACFSARDKARADFIVNTMTYLITKPGAPALAKTYDHKKLESFGDQLQEEMATRIRTSDTLGATVIEFINITLGRDLATPINGTEYTARLANIVAYLAALVMKDPKDRATAMGTLLYSLTYVSLSKRGNITDAKLERVVQEICTETNMRFDLSSADISTLARIMEPMVTEVNAPRIMEGLSLNIAPFSLRLRIMIDQSARGGMTAYWTIREAMTIFPTFDWWLLSRYITNDFSHFAEAVTLVGNNEYYGFRTNLGRASHTNYKSLAWVCIQLLIRHRGADYASLTHYRGLTKQPDHRDRLLQMIEEFVPPVGELEFAGIDDLLQEVTGHPVPRPAGPLFLPGPPPPPAGGAAGGPAMMAHQAPPMYHPGAQQQQQGVGQDHNNMRYNPLNQPRQ